MSEQREGIQGQLWEAVQQALESGYSLNALAKAAGVSQPIVQRWFKGTRPNMELSNAAKLAEFLGMRLTKPNIPPPKASMPNRGRKIA